MSTAVPSSGEGSSVLTPEAVPDNETAADVEKAATDDAPKSEAAETPTDEVGPATEQSPQAAEPEKKADKPAAAPAPKLASRKPRKSKPAAKAKSRDGAKLKKAAAAGAQNVSKKEQRRIQNYAKGVRRELTPREARTLAIVYVVSIVLHVAVLSLLFFVRFGGEITEVLSAITSEIQEPPDEVEEPIEVVETDEPMDELVEDDAPPEEESITEELEPAEAPIDINPVEPEEAAPPPPDVTPDAPDPSRLIEKQGDLAGRASNETRQALRDKYGGNAETDAAVFSGLNWLQKQQQADGSWHFDKVKPGSKAGTLKQCDTGATGMVLLSFLGAGQTHLAGKYKQTVYNGCCS